MTRIEDKEGVKILTPLLGHRAACEMLRYYSVSDILHLDRRRLLKLRHVGPRKADVILALPNLLRQLVNRSSEGVSVSCSKDVFNLFRLRLSCLAKEEFLVLTLDTRNQILSEDLCAVGSINTVHVNPSTVIRQAVIRSAPSIICLHNHPSGDPTPSPEDRILTERICQASALMGIRMLDHVIVAGQSYYSFSDAGAL